MDTADQTPDAADQIHLICDISLIHTNAKWRYPDSWQGYGMYGDPGIYFDIAKILERGRFDGAFFADVAGTPMVNGSMDPTIELGVAWPRHDPIPMVSAMSAVTTDLGFVTTMSMTYNHPFHTARMMASLDHVTRGRVAFNAVVSGFPQEAQNYGYDTTPDHEWRYQRATEFQQVLAKLFASVESDAMVWNRETGQVADPSKVHRIDHEGEFFKVMGPLPTAPSPQGRPMQVMAGQSESGMRLAAQFAELQFAGGRGVAGKAAHRARLDAKLAEAGRSPRDLGVVWAGSFDVVSGAAEANENARLYRESFPPGMPHVFLSQWWGLDGWPMEPDAYVHETIAAVRAAGAAPNWGYLDMAMEATTPTTTIREYALQWLVEGAEYVGTPERLADMFEEQWNASGRNGGFMIAPRSGVPGGIERFVDEVVPVLQRRGLYKSEYTGATMRENVKGR
ncbi:NtaA/DmoA family FMN-dependent monooxygenase [Rathayibacter sp. VKM Ac-2754]|uniref:NtaA/DmoA family FMN-dependent monooxygenase n=1 Tax=Rathayibacter sp. VKM Ac-2754 TaxID=2609251 RepID=UPI00135CA04B|nr:NtaA/DmoA family FMN-dependent monooxygenase [Rathayibacter sp. VKM Ac-2754]MWV58939.1 NtaA/DmoA family FMN-dependent monooxygenase [Rathayibacter sp. VKM Ac-2754]